MSLQASLLMPVFGMIVLTIVIALWMLKLRYKAVLEDGVSVYYFKLNRGAKLPDYLVRVTQHYENLFETPVIYYVAIVLIIVLDVNDSFYAGLSWAYLLSRLVHACIHTISNRLKFRKYSFMASSLVLMVLWARLFIDTLTL